MKEHRTLEAIKEEIRQDEDWKDESPIYKLREAYKTLEGLRDEIVELIDDLGEEVYVKEKFSWGVWVSIRKMSRRLKLALQDHTRKEVTPDADKGTETRTP